MLHVKRIAAATMVSDIVGYAEGSGHAKDPSLRSLRIELT
jgi:hypothetical protein